MDDRDRERDAGQPDPTHDTWSAWLPQLDRPTSSLPQESEQPEPVLPPAPAPQPQPAPPPFVWPAPPAGSAPPPPRTYAGRGPSRPQAHPLAFAPPPPNRLGLAILCTILCFMPFGIVALVKATTVNGLWAEGRADEAYRASRSVRTWCVLAALVWPVVPILMIGLFIFVSVAHALA